MDSSLAIHSDTSILEDREKELGASIQANERTAVRFEQSLIPSLYFFTEKLILRTPLHLAQSDITFAKEELAERFEETTGIAISYKSPNWGQILIQEQWLFTQDHLQGALANPLLYPGISGDEKKKKYITDHHSVRLGIYPLGILKELFFTQANKRNKQASKFELYALISQAKRLPAITEAYGDGRLIRGNPSLEPERVFSQSYGLSGNFSFFGIQFDFSSSFFKNRAQELIIFVQNSPHTIYAENVGASILEGIEGELQLDWQPYILSHFRFTYLSSQDKGELPYYYNKQLPFQPRYAAEYYLEAGLWPFKSFVNVHWLGSLYRDQAQFTATVRTQSLAFGPRSALFFLEKIKKAALALVSRTC